MKLNFIQISCGFLVLVLLSPTFALAVSEKQVTTTDVGTYDVTLKTNPAIPKLGEKTHLFIEVISKKIRDTQPHVDYQILILKDNQEVFSSGSQHTHTGTASVSHTFDSPGEYVVVVFIDGIVFEPIPLEAAAFSLPVGQTVDEPTPPVTKESEPMKETSSKTFIPEWIKDVAAFWVDDQIDDSGFVQVIEWLVQNEIIKIPYAEPPPGEAAVEIPNWIKTNAEFWVNGDVSDDEFATALEWLINKGVIRV